MNDTDGRYVTIELTCFYCGHGCSDVRVPGASRPTNRALRAAYAATPGAILPEWDTHGQPRCPRCQAKLFMEQSERRRAHTV